MPRKNVDELLCASFESLYPRDSWEACRFPMFKIVNYAICEHLEGWFNDVTYWCSLEPEGSPMLSSRNAHQAYDTGLASHNNFHVAKENPCTIYHDSIRDELNCLHGKPSRWQSRELRSLYSKLTKFLKSRPECEVKGGNKYRKQNFEMSSDFWDRWKALSDPDDPDGYLAHLTVNGSYEWRDSEDKITEDLDDPNTTKRLDLEWYICHFLVTWLNCWYGVFENGCKLERKDRYGRRIITLDNAKVIETLHRHGRYPPYSFSTQTGK